MRAMPLPRERNEDTEERYQSSLNPVTTNGDLRQAHALTPSLTEAILSRRCSVLVTQVSQFMDGEEDRPN